MKICRALVPAVLGGIAGAVIRTLAPCTSLWVYALVGVSIGVFFAFAFPLDFD